MTTAFERSEKTGREPEGRVRRTELPEAGRKKDIETQISEMEEMKLPELQAKFAEVVGEETKAPNKKYLIKRILEVLEQDDFQGDEQAEMDANIQVTNDAEQSDEPIEADDDSSEEETSLTKLDVDTLRNRYNEIVGRPTGSTDKRYLIWKIRQAQKGKIPVGPIPGRRGDGIGRDYKVLPVRMEADLVEKLDEAWKRQGLESRMQLFRQALSTYLAGKGETELAEMLVL